MKPSGARGIARIASNPSCRLQAAMVDLVMPEDRFFATLVGHPYPGDRGERTAAYRWGHRFESSLVANHAARLLKAIDGQLGITAATATVRNLLDEVPGEDPAAYDERHHRARLILTDLVAGRPTCDLVLQPPLRLPVRSGQVGFIVPDALVLDRLNRVFLPVEIKAYVTRDGVAEPGDRAAMRLQAAVQVLALRAEFSRIGVGSRVTPRALLVLATPFGARPLPACLERLDSEVVAIEEALHTLAATAAQLAFLRQTRPLGVALRHLPHHFQDACLTSCTMAEVCRQRSAGMAGDLGDRMATRLGAAADLDRVLALLAGDPAATAEERRLLEAMAETATIFAWGWP